VSHIAASFGLDESNLQRAIKGPEDTLIRYVTLSLSEFKALLKNGAEFKVVLIDAIETPV
jgi:hypothetical protein